MKSFVSGLMHLVWKAIGKFLDGLEGQERRGFEEMHSFLATLPVPTPQVAQDSETEESKGMTHAEALKGKSLPDLDEEQRKRFTPTELIMYGHAQDFSLHRLAGDAFCKFAFWL